VRNDSTFPTLSLTKTINPAEIFLNEEGMMFTTRFFIAFSTFLMASSGANAQRTMKPFQTTIQNAEFLSAEKSGDVASMQRMLGETKLIVSPVEPALGPVCKPPYGTLQWGLMQHYGTHTYYNGIGYTTHTANDVHYAQYCSRGGGIVKMDPVPETGE
jgi:hypothetical protein